MGKAINKIIKVAKEATANPELDKTKAALKDLKGRTTAELLKGKVPTLDDDLNEIKNLSQEQRAGLKESFVRDAIKKSPEAANLSAFVDEWANYTGLNDVIAECKAKDSKKPLKKLVQFARANAPLLATIGAGLTAWLNEGKEKVKGKKKKKGKKGKPSKLDQAAAKADAILGKGKKKKGKKPKKGSSEGQGGNTEAPSGGSGSASGGSGMEAEPVGTEKYEIKPEYSKKLSKKDFRKKYLSIKNRKERNTFVLQQVAAGNASNAFKKLKIKGKGGMTVTMEVDRSGLQVAGMDVQLDGPTAMTVAQLSGCTLPTKWISEKAHQQAVKTGGVVKFIAAPEIAKSLGIPWDNDKPNGNRMMSAKFALRRDKLLKKWRAEHGIKDGQLTSGYFKDIVHPVPGRTRKGMLEIYGGKGPARKNAKGEDLPRETIQGLSGGAHVTSYSDYSHQLRRVKNTVTVTENGKTKKISISEFYANKKYAKAFGFKAQKLGKAYMTPELQAFADKKKGKKGDKPEAAAPKAVAAADKKKGKKTKKDKPKKG